MNWVFLVSTKGTGKGYRLIFLLTMPLSELRSRINFVVITNLLFFVVYISLIQSKENEKEANDYHERWQAKYYLFAKKMSNKRKKKTTPFDTPVVDI